MKALKWHQVHAWRLSQHGLFPRLDSGNFVEAVTRTGGIQAQVMSAAELGLFSRVEGLRQQDVRSALWQDHTLIKTWAMRGTLHLLSAKELPLYVAARDWHLAPGWSNYFAEFGMTTAAQQEAYLSAIPHVLEQGPMTRQQLADAVAKQTGIAQARDFIISANWGSPLKPSAYRGDLCFGPSQGQNVTFVNPKGWVGSWQSIEPEEALKHIVRLYLQTYGPATPEDFARWWGGKITQAKKLFKAMRDELEEVEVEGWQACALGSTLEAMQGVEVSETLHLLPLFDVYTIGVPRGLEAVLCQAYKSQIFRAQGWISAVVLVNGSIQGVWQYTTRRSQVAVKVRLFCPPTAAIHRGIEAEAERLGDFFKREVSLEYKY
jgi:Winged helix DNA-binding domain